MSLSPVPNAPTALTDVLAALGDRVAPVSMALERTLPTPPECAELFAEGGLVRGRVLSSVGPASTTVALRLVAAAVAAGGWMAVVDVPTLGLDAASELGIALERVVSISTTSDAAVGQVNPDVGDDVRAGVWADVVAAAADGFDVVITRVPVGVRAATARKVATRLQQRGVVLVALGDPGPLVCDGVIGSGRQVWSGVGAGWGRIEHRSVEVTATGRRLAGQRCRTLEFPLPSEVEASEAQGVKPVAKQTVSTPSVARELSNVS